MAWAHHPQAAPGFGGGAYPEVATINGFVAYIAAHRGASGGAGA